MRRGVDTGRVAGAARPLCSVLLLVVAALAATTGTTSAPFADDAVGRGRPQAGRVDVVVDGDPDDVATFTFTGPSCTSLAPGEFCSTPVTVHNAGTLVATYNVHVIDSGNLCFRSRLSSEAALESGAKAPGHTLTGTLTTTLVSDAPRCQGLASNSVVTVHARQARTPQP